MKFPATFIPHASQLVIEPEPEAEPEQSEPWAEPAAPVAEEFYPPPPPVPRRVRGRRAVSPPPPRGISEAQAAALFEAACWAAHDTAERPEFYTHIEQRAKVHDAAMAADAARRARQSGANRAPAMRAEDNLRIRRLTTHTVAFGNAKNSVTGK